MPRTVRTAMEIRILINSFCAIFVFNVHISGIILVIEHLCIFKIVSCRLIMLIFYHFYLGNTFVINVINIV